MPPPSGSGTTAPATGKPDGQALRDARLKAQGKPPGSAEVMHLQRLLSQS